MNEREQPPVKGLEFCGYAGNCLGCDRRTVWHLPMSEIKKCSGVHICSEACLKETGELVAVIREASVSRG